MEALIAWALVGLLLVFASAPWWVFWRAKRINRRHEEEYQSSREAVNEAFRKQWAEKEAERLRRKFGVR